MNGLKRLEEFTFADLYVEIPEQSFPFLRAELRNLGARLHKKKDELILFMLLLPTNKLTPPRLRI